MKLFHLVFVSLFATSLLQAQISGNNAKIEIKNETGINSSNWEFGPVFYQDGLVFTTTQNNKTKYAVEDTRINENIMSIWRAARNGEGMLENPMPLAKELLSDVHELGVSFNSSGEVIYFTRNDTRETSETSGNNLKQLNIYTAENVAGKWTNISAMSFNEDGYNTIHPTVHPDLEELYFSSDRPGGYGGYDLYVVRKIGGEWSSPINLGPQVNTPDHEVFPFIHADNTLYFSSTGHAGRGGLDLYYTTKNREIWKRPTNLGEPFNSSSDDFALILDRDEKNGYFSSDRSGGQGGDDIYGFTVEGVTKSDEILVSVIDGITNDPIDAAKVKYINLNEVMLGDGENAFTLTPTSGDGEFGLQINSRQANDGQTDTDGKFILSVPDGQYVLKVSKDGYIPYQLLFDVPSNTNDNNTYIVPLDRAVDCIPFSGNVVAGTTPQSGVDVVITDVSSGEKFTATTDENGSYEYCLKCGRDYKVTAQKGQVNSGTLNISTINRPCNESFVLDNQRIDFATNSNGIATTAGGGYTFTDENGNVIVGAPLKVGSTILLPNIYYNFNDSDLRPDAKNDLKLIETMLKMYPDMRVNLVSHTDSRGSDSYNQQLSERRSIKAVDYLVEMGIDRSRVTPIGKGETKPRNRCVNGRRCSETEHQENRRTEVIIVELGNTFSSTYRNDEAMEQLTDYTLEGGRGSQEAVDYQDDYQNDFDNNSSDNFNSNSNTSTFNANLDKPFYVIAGTFRSNNNAQGRLTEVQDLGFYNAEVIQFDFPDYHAVCVDKFTSEQEARDLVNRLQGQHNVDAYVRRME